MGFRFRKSKNIGPFRINVSKSGVGWSVGTKGVRYTKRADGKTQTTYSIPGTGLSYVDVNGSNSKNTSSNNGLPPLNTQSFNTLAPKIPFYKKTWFMWLMLIFIPPIGIILMWLNSNYKKVTKIILSVFFGIIAIASYSSVDSSSTQNIQDNNAQTVASTSENTEEKAPKLTGWQNIDNKSYFYDKNGVKQTGWIQDNNKYYYCNSDGIMQTGWITDNNKNYYLDAAGVLLTGWILDNNTYYYSNSDGQMQTGWIQDKGNWYYMNSDGSMATNTTLDGYTIDDSGIATKQQTEQASSTASSSNSTGVTTYDPAESGRTVYWTPGGKSYHYSQNCPTLSRSKTILSGTADECPKTDPCNKCTY